MISLAICDDNPAHTRYAANLISEEMPDAGFLISEYSSGEELLFSCAKSGSYPDIAVLDIEMPGVDGLELASKLNELAPGCIIIFLSAYTDYMKSAYYTEHVWFIYKAEIKIHLKPALTKALAMLSKNKAEQVFISVNQRGTQKRIAAGDVLYLERQRNKTKIVTSADELFATAHPEAILEGCENLFVRCHQSYWVNVPKISSRDKNSFILNDGTAIPISRTHKAEATKRFFEYLHP